MTDRRQGSVDGDQVKFSLPVVLGAIILVGSIIGTGMASYYGSRLAFQKNLSEVSERLAKVEGLPVEIDKLNGKVADLSEYYAAVYQGVWILLHDRGYDADKVLGKIDANRN